MRTNSQAQPLPADDGVPEALLEAVRRRAHSFVGTLTFLNGEAELRDAVTGSASPAEAGIRLSSECALKVLRGSALLRLDDGSDVWLAEGGELDFSRWCKTGRDLGLAAGRLLALVAREATRPFQVLTPLASITVTGTAFETNATAKKLDVAVFHGCVECRSGAGQARARRGQAVRVEAGGAPQLGRLRPEAAYANTGMLLALSSENPKIEAACRAVGRAYHKPGVHEWRNTGMARWKMIAIVFLCLVAGAFACWRLQRRVPAAADKPAMASAPAGQAQPAARPEGFPAGKPGESVRVTRIRRPGQKDEVYRTQGDGQKPVWPPPGMTAQQAAAMQRVMSTGISGMQDLVKSGVPPQKASAIIQRGLQESLNKQFQAQGKAAPKISVQSDGRKTLLHVKTGNAGGEKKGVAK